MMRSLGNVGAVMLLFALVTPAAAAVPACITELDNMLPVEGVTVSDVANREGQYGVLLVRSEHGAHMRVYYDAGSETFTRVRAPCLGAQLAILRKELGDTRKNPEWASVVFTTDPLYAPPRDTDAKTRWVVYTNSSEPMETDPQVMVMSVIPHEQVHDFQYRADAYVPRWFSEGHASWMELRITASLQSSDDGSVRIETMKELSDASGPIDLINWGTVRPKREAIMRQVSADDRARMEVDPTYTPSGSYSFTSDDFEDDESNMGARYAAALLVFEGLEHRHGAGKIRDWVVDVTSVAGMVARTKLSESVRRHFNEDLETLLADPVSN